MLNVLMNDVEVDSKLNFKNMNSAGFLFFGHKKWILWIFIQVASFLLISPDDSFSDQNISMRTLFLNWYVF